MYSSECEHFISSFLVCLPAIPLFGVMTKMDQVAKDGKKGDVSEELFEKRKKLFIDRLGLKGTTRYIFASNYCNNTDEEQKRLETVIPEIDAPLLKFMIQVCDPVNQVINTRVTFTESQTDVRRRRQPQEEEKNKQKDLTEMATKNWSDAATNISGLRLKLALACFIIFIIHMLFIWPGLLLSLFFIVLVILFFPLPPFLSHYRPRRH